MPNELKLRRIAFRDVSVGHSFYDPVSAEYFVKRAESHAAMISGMGDGNVLDEFDPDDIVGVGQDSSGLNDLPRGEQS